MLGSLVHTSVHTMHSSKWQVLLSSFIELPDKAMGTRSWVLCRHIFRGGL